MLADNGIALSMDGKGAWQDNVFVERLLRSIKHEKVCLRTYEGVSRRPNSGLDGGTPDQAYFSPLPLRMPA